MILYEHMGSGWEMDKIEYAHAQFYPAERGGYACIEPKSRYVRYSLLEVLGGKSVKRSINLINDLGIKLMPCELDYLQALEEFKKRAPGKVAPKPHPDYAKLLDPRPPATQEDVDKFNKFMEPLGYPTLKYVQ